MLANAGTWSTTPGSRSPSIAAQAARARRCVATSIVSPSVIVTARSPSGAKRMGVGLARCVQRRHQLVEDACCNEARQEVFVEHALPRLHRQDLEGALPWDGPLVWAVLRGESIEDVGDGHDARLHRDRLAGDGSRIAAAVELFVMAERDLRNAPELTRPRNLLEEPIGMRDVRLDLAPLAGVEVALADHQELQLVVAEQPALDATQVHVRDRVDLTQLLEAAFGEDRRFVGVDDGGEMAVELVSRGVAGRAKLVDGRVVRLTPAGEQPLDPHALEREVGGLREIREAAPDELQIARVELLFLDEHFLAHADFAEVVQQPGVPQLAQLIAREAHVAIRSFAAAVDGLRESDGEGRNAARMTRRR